ncbi:MAG: 2-dehydro-3-deoxyglucarate aldolase [Modestobacter sp.]|nr:2-dehydro-3-deoxyglucarate aldolase [Modestobacter sp.]MCW2508025.1 2-dehydro-3-deoxyglucarate aldolase [Modestobacter sp.]MCW2577998.1 2-dehydro-3-deoxyglucarate aldolase [Modestobacter sp.]
MSTATGGGAGRRWKQRLAAGEPLVGMWVATGSPYVAEICAGAGLDWLLIDSEHAPNDLRSIQAQLQAVAAYPVVPVVRPPSGDPVVIKQLLDAGVEALLVPMVESGEEAAALVAATRYPPAGIRGVGSALARASRWNRIPDYLATADDGISLMVQVESVRGLAALPDILAVDGLDGVFLGPADLAGSMGHLGRPDHPEVVAAVEGAIDAITAAGLAAGVNAFVEETAQRYLDRGVRYVLVGADATLLARGSEALATRHREQLDR